MTLVDELSEARRKYEELRKKLESEIKIGDSWDANKENTLSLRLEYEYGFNVLHLNYGYLDNYLNIRLEDWPKFRSSIEHLIKKYL